MPVSAYNRFLLHAGTNCVHTVIPAGCMPFTCAGISPSTVITIAFSAVNTWDPSVYKNIVIRFIAVQHGRDDRFVIRGSLCRIRKIIVPYPGHRRIEPGKLQSSLIGTICHMMAVRQSFICCDQFLKQILMITAD